MKWKRFLYNLRPTPWVNSVTKQASFWCGTPKVIYTNVIRLNTRLDRSQSRLLIDGSQTRLDRYQYYRFRDVLGQRDDKQRVSWVSDFSEPQYLVVKSKALCCSVELLGKVHEVFFARFRSSDQKKRWQCVTTKSHQLGTIFSFYRRSNRSINKSRIRISVWVIVSSFLFSITKIWKLSKLLYQLSCHRLASF